jgi:hypothetical protein
MTVLLDHVPFTRAPGAYPFGPRSIADDKVQLVVRLARCTTPSPTIWPSVACQIVLQLYTSVDGAQREESAGIGHATVDALDLFNAGTTVAELIAAGNLAFGASGGVWINRDASEAIENVLKCPLPPGINREVTGLLGVRGGTLITELTVEVV